MMGFFNFLKGFGKGAARVGVVVGIPALETFLPQSKPIVELIKQAVSHHNEDFSVESFLKTALPVVQEEAKFSDAQMPFIAGLITAAVESAVSELAK
jgi:hypothetical protein